MVPGSAALLEELADWVRRYPFSERWYVAAQRLTAQISPDAMLFRIDWNGESPVALTWYSRFPRPPDEATFQGSMEHAAPWRWVGPDPCQIAKALGLPGPRGVALRVDEAGNGHTAVYFRVQCGFGAGNPLLPAPLLGACGLPGAIGEEVAADLTLLGATGDVEVVGVDQGEGIETVGALKVDPAGVPLSGALRLLAAKGARPDAQSRLTRLATSLRARSLSYMGLKYASAGFAGWRAYFSTEPARLTCAGSVRIASRIPAGNRPRLPDY
jgi:hypothetical protein